MENIIFEYVSNSAKNTRTGIVVASVMADDPSRVGIGWAAVNSEHGDKFDFDMGMRIARSRANTGTRKRPHTAEMSIAIENMKVRAARYFQDKVVIDTTIGRVGKVDVVEIKRPVHVVHTIDSD